MSVADLPRAVPSAGPWDAPAVRTGGARRLVGRLALPAADAAALAVAAAGTGAARWFGAAYSLGVFAALGCQGLHRVRICLRTSDQLPQLAVAVAVPLLALLPWAPDTGLLPGFGALVAVVAARGAVCAALRVAHRRGVLSEPAVLVGSGSTARHLAALMVEHPELGLRPRGFLAPRGSGDVRPLLGEPADLAAVAARFGVTRVIVCSDAPEVVSALRAQRPRGVDCCVVPRLAEIGMAVPRGRLDDLWGVPLLPLRRPGRGALVAKRVFDVVVGALLLVVLAPVLLALAAAVRLSGRGPTFFRQLRVTRSGRTTEVVKLRTVAAGHPGGWAVRAEECTAVGRHLRRTHLDELPQLVNVLRGDMSLVGPRPERPYYAVRFAREIPRYADRHRMRGGMTGWAQVNGLHGDTSIRDRARFDNHYVEYWSPWWDAVIVARTAGVVLREATRVLIQPGGNR
ncbi:sugar transferase [Saccharopolyspora rosea]|uniref:sugar transferase n=1 Tax=Saccharopolyspora rosea TaxID=524884 RepID=UPI0021DACC5B|nr:sugar transferase [Saccharopolyspora rosea]